MGEVYSPGIVSIGKFFKPHMVKPSASKSHVESTPSGSSVLETEGYPGYSPSSNSARGWEDLLGCNN